MHIRALTKADAIPYRNLRLRALKEHPEAFGASYEESAKMPIAHFAERIDESADRFVLGAFHSDGQMIGMVGFHRNHSSKTRHKADVWGMYVAREHQSAGIGRRLLTELIERARMLPELEQIRLSVVTSNIRAALLYASIGFQAYGLERRALKAADQYFDEMLMVLSLEKDERDGKK